MRAACHLLIAVLILSAFPAYIAWVAYRQGYDPMLPINQEPGYAR